MNIGKFIMNKEIVDSLYKYFSIFDSIIHIFICENGFCITQNISETINLNVFIPTQYFRYYKIEINHIIFSINIIQLKLFQDFILVSDKYNNHNITILSNKGIKETTKKIDDVDMYDFCKNINSQKCVSDMLIDKKHFEILLKDNKKFIKKFCNKLSLNYDMIRIKFYNDVNGFTLHFKDDKNTIDYVFNICV